MEVLYHIFDPSNWDISPYMGLTFIGQRYMIPSGKLSRNYGLNHHFEWENSRNIYGHGFHGKLLT